jgi:hypothetical protein
MGRLSRRARSISRRSFFRNESTFRGGGVFSCPAFLARMQASDGHKQADMEKRRFDSGKK